MKYKVTLVFEIDTDDYEQIKPTLKSAKDLIEMMLNDEADFPEAIDTKVEPI